MVCYFAVLHPEGLAIGTFMERIYANVRLKSLLLASLNLYRHSVAHKFTLLPFSKFLAHDNDFPAF